MKKNFFVVTTFLVATAISAVAGGPLIVGGPNFGVSGQPFRWDPSKMPIQYRVDPGPMSATATATVISNATGLQRVAGMFSVWTSVPTAALSANYAGPLLAAGAYTGGDVTTVAQFDALYGSCQAGTQSPVIFDADGSLFAALGLPPEAIGFASPCDLDSTTGFITTGFVAMSGKFQDGDTTNPYLLTGNEFDEALTHEIGHFLGLDHSQINVIVLAEAYSVAGNCPSDLEAGLPLMFPELICQARKDAGLPVLAPDDIAWISTLYPNAQVASSYGTISGTIYFADGTSQFHGANVIARFVDDPSTSSYDESLATAVSVVSGYRFTGNLGQSVSVKLPEQYENNVNGDKSGSRDANLIGYYEMKVPPGTYTVQVEGIDPSFVDGSSVGPLNPPVPFNNQDEYWNVNDAAFENSLQRDTITIHAGDNVTGINIILSTPFKTFDQYEDGGAQLMKPPISPANDEELAA